ncbi:MAG TPA: P-type conjugative transfer protein TrbG [Gammaproteobacteria bacterium]|nr:P-type conjugative transfer protein TrbG [Gammaproteobacteria bacterium]
MKTKIVTTTSLFIAISVLSSGCATLEDWKSKLEEPAKPAKKTTFVKAKPARKASNQLPVPSHNKAVSKSMTLAQWHAKFQEDDKAKTRASHDNPYRAIQQANREARRSPNKPGYFNSIMQYDYEPGALFQVYTAPLRLTDIQLRPGERIMGKPAAGDTVRWILGVNESVANDQIQQHVLVKPTRAGLNTTLYINTNQRTYLLELSSHPKTFMAAVNWRYPQEELNTAYNAARAKQERDSSTLADNVDISRLSFDYRISKRSGSPDWTPTQVFDDGKKVYIRFPKARANSEAPALFIVTEEGDQALVNYRVKGDMYIVDRLFQQAELRVGQKKQAVVNISKHAAKKSFFNFST